MDLRSNPLVLALLSVLFWSTSAVVAKIGEGMIDSITIVVSQFIIGFVLFAIISQYNGSIKHKLLTLQEEDDLEQFTLYAGLTGLFLGLYYYTFYFSIQSPFSVQANLINYLWPTITPLLAALLFKSSKPIGYKSIVALIVSFIGCGIVITGLSIDSFEVTIYHISALIAALSAGLYMNFAMLAEEVQDDISLVYMIALGTILPFVAVLVYTQTIEVNFSLRAIPYAIYIGVFPFVFANLAWTRSIINGNTSKISKLAYLIPVSSTLLLAIISPLQTTFLALVLGGGLVIIGQMIADD
jgi:drug/metabolite transporter (DMT)-like permease